MIVEGFECSNTAAGQESANGTVATAVGSGLLLIAVFVLDKTTSNASGWNAVAGIARLCLVRHPEAGQRHSGEADAEFLERRAACDGLSHAFC